MNRRFRLLLKDRALRRRTLRAAGLGLMIAVTVEAAGIFGDRRYKGTFSFVQPHYGLGFVAGSLIGGLIFWLMPNN